MRERFKLIDSGNGEDKIGDKEWSDGSKVNYFVNETGVGIFQFVIFFSL
jgi:hypothetical protein